PPHPATKVIGSASTRFGVRWACSMCATRSQSSDRPQGGAGPAPPRGRPLNTGVPMPTPRYRITDHRRVRAGDLVPHELNPRTHSTVQRAALAALYEEIGFARSLLAYTLPDGRLKLIDGHLRRDMDPDMEVDVEVLDVSDDEA